MQRLRRHIKSLPQRACSVSGIQHESRQIQAKIDEILLALSFPLQRINGFDNLHTVTDCPAERLIH